MAGQKFPCPEDGLTLEIIAKAEVAEHFKERVVSRGSAHVVDITSAEALLAGSGPGELEFTFPEKVVFELVHTRGCKQHRRIPAWHKHITGATHTAL